MSHTADPVLVDTVDRLLEAACDASTVDAVERGEPARALWDAIARAGLNRAWMPASAGGGESSVADVCMLARLAGRHVLPVPLVDTMLAGHLAAAHGLVLDDTPHALAAWSSPQAMVEMRGGRLHGRCRRVAFARHAARVVLTARAEDGLRLALIDPARVTVDPGATLAGEPRDDLVLDHVEPLATAALLAPWSGDAPLLAGAMLRAEQMTGALERILAMSVHYAGEREAFGRPIGKFQAVQHALAMLAGEVAAATAAANAAMIAWTDHGPDAVATERAVAGAKIRVGEAASAGAAIAHQVHGAMGFTHEHRLHQLTRRLWSWRDDHGPETTWAIRLGRLVAAAGAEALWADLTAS
ncbi:MAG: acyl-CoA/acyl-ACP dehydrogenase [Ectothiorhodospiraceae bacterium]|nr:acyl-CoA/acyl-ACP dehydrogenase [Chromatiales bacterium]MCP5153720.1 acyl-CoA/acyl-ACP dehydrogenase [Ectothiorhodospiraceae bacterium]